MWDHCFVRVFFLISLIFAESQIPAPVGIPQEMPAFIDEMASSMLRFGVPLFVVNISDETKVAAAAISVNRKEYRVIRRRSIFMEAGCGFILSFLSFLCVCLLDWLLFRQ